MKGKTLITSVLATPGFNMLDMHQVPAKICLAASLQGRGTVEYSLASGRLLGRYTRQLHQLSAPALILCADTI